MSAPPGSRRVWGFVMDAREAFVLRTAGLVCGVLLLQMGFIFSYVAAFHDPKPHRVPVAIVAPASVAPRLVGAINALPGDVARARVASSRRAAAAQIRAGSTSAAIIVNPVGTTDRLLYAAGGGDAVATTVQEVAGQVEARYHRRIVATDLVPLQPGDGRGLSGFYLVVGWIVGGYLMASLLGVVNGMRHQTARKALIRLLGIVPYAIVSGFGGALIVDQLLGALTGHFLELALLGVLVVAATAAATMAFQVLLGTVGIGAVILVFVVLGNPSAGGPYQPSLLPGFWRAISGWLPNGAGTDTVRRIVYFGSNAITGHLLVLSGYLVIGAAVAVIGTQLHARAQREAVA